MTAHGKGYQTARVVVNVTPEQATAVKAALNKEIAEYTRWYQGDPEHRQSPPSRNDILLALLAGLCVDNNVPWLEHIKARGQRGENGKFIKSS